MVMLICAQGLEGIHYFHLHCCLLIYLCFGIFGLVSGWDE